MYTVGPGPVCKCTGQCTLEGSVPGGGVYTGGAKLHSLPIPTHAFHEAQTKPGVFNLPR